MDTRSLVSLQPRARDALKILLLSGSLCFSSSLPLSLSHIHVPSTSMISVPKLRGLCVHLTWRHSIAGLWKTALEQALKGDGWSGRGAVRLVNPPPGFKPGGAPD